jgi:hypothetical protein
MLPNLSKYLLFPFLFLNSTRVASRGQNTSALPAWFDFSFKSGGSFLASGLEGAIEPLDRGPFTDQTLGISQSG